MPQVPLIGLEGLNHEVQAFRTLYSCRCCSRAATLVVTRGMSSRGKASGCLEASCWGVWGGLALSRAAPLSSACFGTCKTLRDVLKVMCDV